MQFISCVFALAITVFGLSYLGNVENVNHLWGLSLLSVGGITYLIKKVTAPQ